MAKTNYLIEGLSGSGKSAVYDELAGRGYDAITTDRTGAIMQMPSPAYLADQSTMTTSCGTSRKRPSPSRV